LRRRQALNNLEAGDASKEKHADAYSYSTDAQRTFKTPPQKRTTSVSLGEGAVPPLLTHFMNPDRLRTHELLIVVLSHRKFGAHVLLGQLRVRLADLPTIEFDEPFLLAGQRCGRIRGRLSLLEVRQGLLCAVRQSPGLGFCPIPTVLYVLSARSMVGAAVHC
jgi:hypothetical protein